ncbi:hotdog family protein [Pseudonocardia sp. DLS-67]
MVDTPLPEVLVRVRRVRGTRADLELGLGPDRPATAPAGLLDVAVLADLALGGALRAQLGAARVLPTVSLTLDQVHPADVERARARFDDDA